MGSRARAHKAAAVIQEEASLEEKVKDEAMTAASASVGEEDEDSGPQLINKLEVRYNILYR